MFSSNDPRLHFGLGSAETVDIEVRWATRARRPSRGHPCQPARNDPRRLSDHQREAAGSGILAPVVATLVPRLDELVIDTEPVQG
jgi:ASPIC and UnbV